jgi:Tfp pilus assembly protein PilN
MPQQINLLTPILLAPRRYFSALALLQASGLLICAGLAAALWLHQRDRSAQAQHEALLASYATERQSLLVARAGLPPPLNASTIQQQLLPLEAGNAERRALLRTLGAETEGQPGQRHSDLLALIARSLPESAWLSELRYTPGRLELSGGTLDTATLRPWLSQLSSHPLLAGQALSDLRVERPGAPGTEASTHPLLTRDGLLANSALPVWAFRVISAPQAASQPEGAAQ